MPIAIAAALLVLLAAAPAAAQVLCSKPLAPSCVDFQPTYAEEPAKERCRQEVREYLEKAQEYLACIEKEAEASLARAKEVAAYFECRAAGRPDCPPPPRPTEP